MKDKILHLFIRLNPSYLAITASVTLLIQITYFVIYFPNYHYDSNEANQVRIIDLSNRIITSVNLLHKESKECKEMTEITEITEIIKNEHCNPSKILIRSEILVEDIASYKLMAGTENKWVNLVGLPSLDLLKLHLFKYQKERNINDLLTGFRQDIPALEESDRLLREIFDNDTEQFRSSYISINTFLLVTALLFYFLSYSVMLRQANFKEETYQEIENRLTDISRIVMQWNRETFKENLSNTRISTLERTIYSKIITMQEEIENYSEQMNLYRTLYTMIGFEIRGITTTIRGGVKSFTKESDEHGVFLGQEIIAATNTLGELAENFNRLLSMGSDQESSTINIHSLLSNLLHALSSKFRQEKQPFDCLINSNIPNEVHGNQVGLFWVLLFNFSKTIKSNQSRKALLHVSSLSADNIEHVTLRFEIMHTQNIDEGLQQLKTQEWRENHDLGSDSNISQTLLKGINNFNIRKYESVSATMLQINIDVTPSKYPLNLKPLEDRRFLICGDTPLQVDVISHIFESYGASLEWAKTPNDIFKCLAQSKDLDAVFLTETLPGIRLNSFCKTLKSRLSKLESKPQLFLSVSNPEIAESVFEYVDHIFYRPADNQTFLNKLIQQLDKVSHDKTVDEQRVLIVEDDEIQQLILGQLLSDFNINSDTADNGESAIDFLVDNNPSIIFMDCIMPGMGGIEATKKIRANEKENDLKQTTIIGATALTGHKEKQECIEAGMDYVISKPYKEEEILRLLKNYLAIQRIS